MKPFKLSVTLFLLATIRQATAQDNFHFSEVKIYSGRSALSSGVGAIATMAANKGSLLSMEVNSTLGQVIYVKKSGAFFYGPSFGQQSNAMWAAPIVMFSPWKWACLTSWDGFFGGVPGKPSWQPNFGFTYQAVDVVVGRLGFGYSLLHFLKERPMHLPYIKYSIPAGPAGIDISATYNVRDQKPMFFIQGFYRFSK